jgi:hypothetical protein
LISATFVAAFPCRFAFGCCSLISLRRRSANQHGRHRVSEKPDASPTTLAQAGIDKNLANRARKAAGLPENDSPPISFPASHLPITRPMIAASAAGADRQHESGVSAFFLPGVHPDERSDRTYQKGVRKLCV